MKTKRLSVNRCKVKFSGGSNVVIGGQEVISGGSNIVSGGHMCYRI